MGNSFVTSFNILTRSNEVHPENTLGAFERVKNHGYGIELDVQLTKDNVLVVFHDASLERMCGVEGKIWDYTAAELQELSGTITSLAFRQTNNEEISRKLSVYMQNVDVNSFNSSTGWIPLNESDLVFAGDVYSNQAGAWIELQLQTPFEYERQERVAGKTKYPFKKMLKLASDGITSFSTKPLKLLGVLGILSVLISIVILAFFLFSTPDTVFPSITGFSKIIEPDKETTLFDEIFTFFYRCFKLTISNSKLNMLFCFQQFL